jgi:hypothetical protein
MGLLKADDGRVATIDEGLQFRKPASETIHISRGQIRDERRWRDCTRERDSAAAP